MSPQLSPKATLKAVGGTGTDRLRIVDRAETLVGEKLAGATEAGQVAPEGEG